MPGLPISSKSGKQMILFIHGFASCGIGAKSRLLIEYFGAEKIVAPDLSHTPDLAITQLKDLCISHNIQVLVGASLGGFYATWLAEHYNIPSVLINPAVNPAPLLDDHRGLQTRWCDGETFEFTRQDAEQLKNYYIDKPGQPAQTHVLLQQGDEILDYKEAANFYKDCVLYIEENGNHRFTNLQQYLPLISQILAAPDTPGKNQ